MPESALHRELVSRLRSAVQVRRSGSWFLFLDANDGIASEGCPPILGSVCPDLYARENPGHHVVIGEAKTSRDLDNLHTEKQLYEYFLHLSNEPSGELLLAVPLMSVGAAHRLCRAARAQVGCEVVPFEVMGWLFGVNKALCEVWRG
jgi:hypothetical protein